MNSIDLRALRPCFEGIVPATIATCSADGIPNVSFVSHVHLVDSKHIATSYQFFSKTRKNILENDRITLKLLDPVSLQPYIIKARYVRSEFEGDLFESMALKLKIIASHEGMSEIFQLKAADVFEVQSVSMVDGYSRLATAPTLQPFSDEARRLEMLQVITERMARARCLEDLFERTLDLLAKFFGYSHIKILLRTEIPDTLVTHYSQGYRPNGVGSEIRFGEGIIGQAAEAKKILQVAGLDLGLRYAQASRESAERAQGIDPLGPRIPLPGLAHPASQIALPLLWAGELLGVMAIESEEKKHWHPSERNTLAIVAHQLASSMQAIASLPETGAECGKPGTAPTPSASEAVTIRYVVSDESLFFNETYLIKNIPAKILWHVLKTYVETGRQEFSNKELRSLNELQLPEFKDNLEARLVLLRKRLEQQCSPIRIVTTGRGRFKIEISGKLELQRAP